MDIRNTCYLVASVILFPIVYFVIWEVVLTYLRCEIEYVGRGGCGYVGERLDIAGYGTGLPEL